MKPQRLTIALLFAFLFLTACSKPQNLSGESDQGQKVGTWNWLGQVQKDLRVLHVTDLGGRPLAKAQVLVGDGLNEPFASNFITTDEAGNFSAPEAWTTPQTVTVAADGFVRASFLNQLPEGQTLQLRVQKPAVQFELKGKGTGFQVRNSDNLVDFALMIPAVQKQDLFSFNLSMFISPQSDVVDVYGNKISLPSNVSVPRQQENYGFIPVTLNKPDYRMYFDAMGTYRVATIRGQFPFKQVVGELQNNKTFLDVINQFSLKGGSLKSIAISQTTQTQDLPVDELNFNQSRSFQTPAFGSDEFMLAVALSPYQNEFLPTDFKNVPANTNFTLTTAGGETPQLLMAVKKKSEQNNVSGKMTAALVPFRQDMHPALLPMIESPQVLSPTDLKMVVPAAPQGINPMATYLVLSTVQRQGVGVDATETSNRVWEVYAKDWQAEVHLPQWPDQRLEPGSMRWEVSYFGSQNPVKAVDLSPRILETVTHATHSSTDF